MLSWFFKNYFIYVQVGLDIDVGTEGFCMDVQLYLA